MALVGLDGLFLNVNGSLCEIVGYSQKELLTKTFQDITWPEDLELDLANARRLLQGEISSYQLEKRYIHKDGHLVLILLTGSLVRDSGEAAPLHRADPGHLRAQATRAGLALPGRGGPTARGFARTPDHPRHRRGVDRSNAGGLVCDRPPR
ncbi:PAS domain S-box protein [Cystobacter fuscus]